MGGKMSPEYFRDYYLRNKAKKLAYQTEYRKNNPEKVQAAVSSWAERNKDRLAEYISEYQKLNSGKVNALGKAYSEAKQKRVPPWLTEYDFWVMEQFYDLAAIRTRVTGFKWEVDHEIPLRGRNVSGLHVPSNLRVVPKTVNASKSNRFLT